MTARVPGSRRHESAATQWFILTDLGLATMNGIDGLHAFVRSLSSAQPIAGAKVTLLARNNEILGTVTADRRGYARFPPGLTRGTGGMASAMLTVDTGGDFAFLDLSKPGFDLSDRGVEGRSAPGPVDVFAATDRGVYQPGEAVHLTALARDERANAIADLPLTLVVVRPDGVEYRRTLLRTKAPAGARIPCALARACGGGRGHFGSTRTRRRNRSCGRISSSRTSCRSGSISISTCRTACWRRRSRSPSRSTRAISTAHRRRT